MAKLKMKRIEIVCAIEHGKELLDFLQRSGTVQLLDAPQEGEFTRLSLAASVSQFDKFTACAQSAQKILDKYAPEKKSMLASFSAPPEITVGQYNKKSDDVDKMLSQCMRINKLAKEIDENKASVIRLETLCDSLKPWLALDVPTSFRGTKSTGALIGTFPRAYTYEQLLEAVAELPGIPEELQAEIVSTQVDSTYVFFLCSAQYRDDIEQALRSIGFARPVDPTKHPPAVRYERYQKEIEKLREGIELAQEKLAQSGSSRADADFVVDYFTVKREKYAALSSVAVDDRLMLVSGYIPEKRADALAKKVEEKYTAAVQLSEPDEDEEVPVLLENKSFAGAVESVTEMYSMPGKSDVDPNPVMAFFYYFLFGIMLSDAGYGLLMVIAMLVAKKKLRLTAKMKKTTDMFLYCGISTVIWGALFGGWFGDIIPVVAENFFGKDLPSLALWFEPVADPMKMLLYSFLFGIIHLFVGLGVHFATLWKNGERLGAVCDVIPVYLLVTGVAPIGAGVIIDVNPTISAVGKYLALAGAVLVVLTSGRSAKNIFGKLGGGLYGLYNIAAGYLGDILSYSRLLALGLSTGVIASVINILGTMPSNKVVKAVMLVIVFVFGHGVNIAINLIGTYVHTNRLQYVEFFSKFYEGGGKSFTPLKANTKYHTIKED